MKTRIQLAINIRIFPTHCACQSIKCKKERWRSPWLSMYKTKVKDRPFAEGSRGCHVLLWLDARNVNAKERHFILPLVIWTFIMQSVAFITSISHDRIKFSFSALISHTYLESNFCCMQHDNLLEGSYSIHRYVWWTLMAKLGLRIFGSTSSISTWCKEFG